MLKSPSVGYELCYEAAQYVEGGSNYKAAQNTTFRDAIVPALIVSVATCTIAGGIVGGPKGAIAGAGVGVIAGVLAVPVAIGMQNAFRAYNFFIQTTLQNRLGSD